MQQWKIEYYEAKHKQENLLNLDDGNITSTLLNLFVIERRVDTDTIDLTETTQNSNTYDEMDDSISSIGGELPDTDMSTFDEFFDCE